MKIGSALPQAMLDRFRELKANGMELGEIREQLRNEGFSPNPDANRVQISQLGLLFQSISELEESEKGEIKGFLQQVREAMKSGNFDAASLAGQAPDILQLLADNKGINLDTALNDFQEKILQFRAGFTGGPFGSFGPEQQRAENNLFNALFGTSAAQE